MNSIQKTVFACMALVIMVMACGSIKAEESTKSNTSKRSAQDNEAFAQILSELADDNVVDVSIAVAQNPNTPIEVLQKLARSADKRVRAAVAQNPAIPFWLLEGLLQDYNLVVVEKALTNRVLSTRYLDRLMQKKDSFLTSNHDVAPSLNDLQKALAQNPNSSAKVLSKIVAKGKPSDEIKKYVAQNKNTSASVLKKLAKEDDSTIRIAVALNPNTSDKVLENLLKDKLFTVRHSVPLNEHLSQKMMKRLATDTDSVMRGWLALNKNLPEVLLRQLANDPNQGIRKNVATNPSTPTDVLTTLANDPSIGEDVLLAFALNPNTPASLIQKIEAKTDSIDLSMKQILLCMNWKISPELLQKIYASVSELKNDPSKSYNTTKSTYEMMIALNPNTPIEVLQQLAKNDVWIIRQYVAKNWLNTDTKMNNGESYSLQYLLDTGL